MYQHINLFFNILFSDCFCGGKKANFVVTDDCTTGLYFTEIKTREAEHLRKGTVYKIDIWEFEINV